MTPRAGQFLAVHSHGFIPESIQFFTKIQEIREHDLKPGELIINHIAGIIHNEEGKLCVYEMGARGCEVSEWERSDYYKNKKSFVLLELVEDFMPHELLKYTISVRKNKGVKGYNFKGILQQIVFTVLGVWIGSKGAKERYYCSEQYANEIHKVKPIMFPKPWLVNPQMFFEDKGIKIVGANFKIK